ncbi:MAG: protein O-GlcNAc transferase [Planctomycetota bacterium]
MNDPQALLNEAMSLAEAGRHAQALRPMRRVAELVPTSGEVWNNLGAMEEAAGELENACESYRRAVAIDPAGFVPYVNLSDSLLVLGDRPGAIEALRVAATLAPDQAVAWSRLGVALCTPEYAAQALGPLQRSLELEPSDGSATRVLGDALMHLGRAAEAVVHYGRALELGERDAELLFGLGHAHLECSQSALAVVVLRECLELFPGHDRAHFDLGKALFKLGCVQDGVEHLRLSLRSSDQAISFASLESLAVIVPGSTHDDHASVLDVRKQLAQRLPGIAQEPLPPLDTRERPMRIGYLSSFFHRDHWMKPVWALLARHDRERFEVHLINDSFGGELAPGYRPNAADRMIAIRDMNNAEAAQAIRRLDLDLLIDLNGHSTPARLPILRSKPARRVVEWFNMYATTGIEEVDFLIGDAQVIEPDEERFYTETVLRVPGSYLSFDVNYPTPDVAPPPCLANGYITFGSLASLYKLTDAVIDSWAKLLQGSPDARLLLKNAGFEHPANREFLLRRFEQRGASRHRIELDGPNPHIEFLRAYDRVDVALDPFPYSGGTTTSEALWQGVPVVSLRGDRWASRTSASIMAACGLGDFVCADHDEYANLCGSLASDSSTPARLKALRAGMRDRVRTSPLGDVEAFARDMEELYARMAPPRAVPWS